MTLYTYHGAKTEARRTVHRELERHHATCLRRSHRQAEAAQLNTAAEPPQPPQDGPTSASGTPQRTARPAPVPAPLFGGAPGLEAAAQEIAAYNRNAPVSEWPAPPPIPAQEEEQPMSAARKLAIIRSCKTPTTAEGRTVTTPRYAAALAALAQCWEARPAAFSTEREAWEQHEHKAARAEVRAAWIEAAQLYDIEPDRK